MIGVLGGTFDPVHEGHLAAGRAVRAAFSLDRVLLVPSALPPHKTRGPFAPAEDRLRMVEIAVSGSPGLEASGVEIDRGGVSYTIETLRALRRGAAGSPPVFVLGFDALLDLPSWREPESLVAEFDLVAVARPGASLDVPRLAPWVLRRLVPCAGGAPPRPLAPPLGAGGRIFVLPIPPVPISSSEVRARAARGESLEGLVPPGVARYIHSRKLYAEEAAR